MKKYTKTAHESMDKKGGKAPTKYMEGKPKQNMMDLGKSKTGAKAPTQFMKAVKAGC
jgi:hypothetical protein